MNKFGEYGELVDSSAISEIGYLPEQNLLLINFNSDSAWGYYNVSYNVWEELRKSDSIGRYFHENIKRLSGRAYDETELQELVRVKREPIIPMSVFETVTDGIFIF